MAFLKNFLTLPPHPLTNFEIQEYYVDNKIVTYFYSFGVEHIPKEIMKFIARKKIIANIYRIQAYDSIMCGFFCIRFINFMFNGKSLKDYNDLFSQNDLKKTIK